MPTFNFKINQFLFLRTDKRSSEVPEGRFLLFTAENILKKIHYKTFCQICGRWWFLWVGMWESVSNWGVLQMLLEVWWNCKLLEALVLQIQIKRNVKMFDCCQIVGETELSRLWWPPVLLPVFLNTVNGWSRRNSWSATVGHKIIAIHILFTFLGYLAWNHSEP